MLDPTDFGFFHELLLTTQHLLSKCHSHISCRWSVPLHVVVEEVEHNRSVGALFHEFARSHFVLPCLPLLLILRVLVQQRILKGLLLLLGWIRRLVLLLRDMFVKTGILVLNLLIGFLEDFQIFSLYLHLSLAWNRLTWLKFFIPWLFSLLLLSALLDSALSLRSSHLHRCKF